MGKTGADVADLAWSRGLQGHASHVYRGVIDGAWSETVSASGMLVRTDEPHTLRCGDRLEVRVYATLPGGTGGAFSDTMALATDAVVVRRSLDSAALRFDAPLAY